LPPESRAKVVRDGVDVVVPAPRSTPPESFSPRAKSHNCLNMIVADHEAHALNPESWAVLLDHSGNLAEGLGCNIFLVREGRLLTPTARKVLPGVPRTTAIQLSPGPHIVLP